MVEGSRLSFLATEPPDPRRASEGVSEGFLKGSRTFQLKDGSKPLQNAFKNPSKTFQQGVEIDDALGFPGLKSQFQGPGVLWQEMKVSIEGSLLQKVLKSIFKVCKV